jgi:hypothetical protein
LFILVPFDRNYVYYWILRSYRGAEEDMEDGLAVASLYSLTYSQKQSEIEAEGAVALYTGLFFMCFMDQLGCGERIVAGSVGGVKSVGENCLSCTFFVPRALGKHSTPKGGGRGGEPRNVLENTARRFR